MPTRKLVALLRAINVGGRNISMDDLRAAFERFGAEGISTYIQTGNVIFSASQSITVLTKSLEKHLASELGYEVDVFLRDRSQLQAASKNNPFRKLADSGTHQSHLMFLSSAPLKANIAELLKREGEEYRFAVKEAVLYYSYANRFAGKRRNVPFERILGVRGTARSYKVVEKLIERLS